MDDSVEMVDQCAENQYLKPTVTPLDFMPYGEKLTHGEVHGFSN